MDSQVQTRLEELRKQFRAVRSLIEMMAKGTPKEELEKMSREKLKPIEEEIKRLEMKEDPKKEPQCSPPGGNDPLE